MKKMKRLAAAFLAGMMMLAMLTACGGGGGSDSGPLPYEKNEAIASSVIEILNDNNFTQSPDFDSLSKIAEKYAQKIALSPTSYDDLNKQALQSLQTDWIDDCKGVFSTRRQGNNWGISPLSGTNSEEYAIEYYTDQINRAIDRFNDYIEKKQFTGTPHYYIYPMYITNPSDPTESVWSFFMILYLIPD